MCGEAKSDKKRPLGRLDSRTLAFLGAENSGLFPWFGDRICEIAIPRCQGEEILANFDTLVNPVRPLSPGAARVNRLANEELAGAPSLHVIYNAETALLTGNHFFDEKPTEIHKGSYDESKRF